MQSMKMLGVCVVAACALAAFTAGSASALPEYGTCALKEGTGKYKDANCTEKALSTEKGIKTKYEFLKKIPGKGGNEKEPLNKFTGEGGAIAFAESEIEVGAILQCEHSKLTGEILVKFSPTTGKQLPSKEVTNVIETFTGCKLNGKVCQNAGGPTGEIESTKVSGGLKGPLGYIKGKGTKTPEVGQELKPIKAKGTMFEFECAGIGKWKVGEGTGKLGDCTIGVVGHVNEASLTSTMTLTGIHPGTELKYEQIPEHFEGKTTHCDPEAKLGESEWFETTQNWETTLTYEVPLQIKA
jgi:hypothetical protein